MLFGGEPMPSITLDPNADELPWAADYAPAGGIQHPRPRAGGGPPRQGGPAAVSAGRFVSSSFFDFSVIPAAIWPSPQPIAPETAARLRRHPLLSQLKPARRKLHAIYFDTPDYDLLRLHGAFRLRREGYRWVQTLKLESGSAAGLSMRPEWEVQVTGNRPDFEVLPEVYRRTKAQFIRNHITCQDFFLG